LHGGWWGGTQLDGGQGEAVRVPLADGTLVALPVGRDHALMPSLLTLSDVMGTGHHAARSARVRPGKIVAVVGDGAVGLCGVIAARRLGAERITMLGRHPGRMALARTFGATDIVSERGDAAIARVRELTSGLDAHSVLECVGHGEAMRTAVSIAVRAAKPSVVVMAYTGHSDFASREPATFVVVGERDGIAPPSIVEKRVVALRAAGTDVEYHKYPGVGHGFGLGADTKAEGWIAEAMRFWEKHMR
jgi:threonine dehydrogenase-like Zn-dependent dehydrogenase